MSGRNTFDARTLYYAGEVRDDITAAGSDRVFAGDGQNIEVETNDIR